MNGIIQMEIEKMKALLLQQLPSIVVGCELHITNDGELIVLLSLNASALKEATREKDQTEQEIIEQYRNETRNTRVLLGRDLNKQYGYDVSWGMRLGETTQFFTSNTKPVMTRLSAEERRVVDTLISANIVHTRSAALSYIVRVFEAEHGDWLEELQQALVHIQQVRDQFQTQRRKSSPEVAPPETSDGLSPSLNEEG